jgi:septal ring factor EnvC (AmiA/AmiB activator)
MARFALIAFAFVLLLAACGDGERIREMQAQLDELQIQLDELQTELEEKEAQLEQARDALTQLEASVEELGYAVDRLARENDDFSFEDWRVNVGDVQSASLAVSRAYNDVEQDLAELRRTLNQ